MVRSASGLMAFINDIQMVEKMGRGNMYQRYQRLKWPLLIFTIGIFVIIFGFQLISVKGIEPSDELPIDAISQPTQYPFKEEGLQIIIAGFIHWIVAIVIYIINKPPLEEQVRSEQGVGEDTSQGPAEERKGGL